MDHPLISVILCTYNGGLFLEEQIASLLQQDYPNFEVVISDDGSTDNTVAIIDRYANRHNFKILKSGTNKGYIKNFESAIGYATGELIAFCDQDDIWLPEKLSTLQQHIGNHLLVYSNSEFVDEKGNSLHKTTADISVMYSGRATTGFILWNTVWGHAMLIKKELLASCLPIPENVPHDIWFAYKATTLLGIVYVDKVLTLYRQHAKTVTKTSVTVNKNAETRSMNEKQKDYYRLLNWFTVMRNHAQPSEQAFYNKLVDTYKQKENGYAWGLFFFMLKHHDAFFMFRQKSFLSKLLEIRKMSRHVPVK
jgi:glycosyltransferase involved in cell wall biosynthesis